jgi:tetratricopeptide (TPR) repeat protein
VSRWLVRAVLLVALAVQTYAAWETTSWVRLHRAALLADASGNAAAALEDFEEVASRPFTPHQAGAYLADAAQEVHDTSSGLSASERARLLDVAWLGYGSTVLRCPADSWSWSGLAEVALARANALERGKSISLEDLDARSEGQLDPWRAVAFGAARLATELKPAGYQELDVLASVYQSMGDTTKAAETYAASAHMMPAPSFHAWGTLTLAPLDLYTMIASAIEDGIRAAPPYEASFLHLDYGRFVERNGNPAKALTEFGAARDAAENDYERFYGNYESARLLLAAKRLDEAAKSLSEARATHIADGALVPLQAALDDAKGDHASACVAWVEVVRSAPADASARLAAASACERSGEPQLAERLLRDGITRPSEVPSLARELIALLVRQNRPSAARDLLRVWRRDDPAAASWIDTIEPPATTP